MVMCSATFGGSHLHAGYHKCVCVPHPLTCVNYTTACVHCESVSVAMLLVIEACWFIGPLKT